MASGASGGSLVITQPDITKSVAAARRLVSGMPGQVRYAASLAINSALRTGYEAEQARMAQVFDRPTPFVLRGGVSVTRATKDKLVGELAVASQSTAESLPPGKPLLAEVQGGARRAKRSEVLLQRAGILPAGWLTVPGRGAKLDAYGNITRGQILEILAWFQTFHQAIKGKRNSWRDNLSDAGRKRKQAGTRNRAGLQYFAALPGGRGGLTPGVYVRQVAGRRFMGPAARPRAVLVFVQAAHYAKRFDFVQQAQLSLAAAFPAAFTAALGRALDTAR